MAPPRKNGWELWRGEVTATLESIGKGLEDLGARFERALTQHADADKAEFKSHDQRLAAIEQSHARLMGKIAVIATLIGAGVAAIAEAAIKKFAG